MIKGGYILQPRIIKSSEVYHMSPCTREVGSLLLREVRYEDNGNLKRGQAFITIDQIRESLLWYVGYRKEMYSRKSVEGSLKVLREKEMIVTTKVTHGMIITVCKYDYYQDPKNYEGNNEGEAKVTTKRQRRSKDGVDIIKKDNKEIKEDIPQKDFAARQTDFINELAKYKDKYDKDILNGFYRYWTEKTKRGEKMKWETQKTWELSKRLATWESNDEKFKRK